MLANRNPELFGKSIFQVFSDHKFLIMQIDFQETEGVEEAGAALPWIVCGWQAFFHFGNPALFSCLSFFLFFI